MDTTKLNDLLNQAEAQESEQSQWIEDINYITKNLYVDEHGVVEVKNKIIGDMSKHISVKGESYSQYIEFKIGRFFDGIDLTKMQLAIYYIIPNVGEDESRPINVYYNENEIKFGWVIPPEVAQVNLTIDFCIYARGKLSDGNDYVLKTKTATYQINDGLEIGSGIIEPTNNWYLNFVLEMDEKVTQASENADRAEQAASSLDGVVETVKTARDEVVQKASTVDTQHSEVEGWHQESEQFRNEAEQFRNEAFQATPSGYEELVGQVSENTDGIEEINSSIEAGFKKQANGEEIHTTDAVDGRLVEFALYGKAKQNTTSGKNLLENKATSQTINGVTFTVNEEEKSILVNGTAGSGSAEFIINSKNVLEVGKKYILNGCPSGGSSSTYRLKLTDPNYVYNNYDVGNGVQFEEKEGYARVSIIIYSGYTANNLVFKPMISVEGGEYEPYTGGQPSPNPQYPQPIEVSGASGSVAVKSVGKNKLNFDSLVGLTDNVVRTFEQSIKVEAKKYYPIFLYSDGTEASGTYLSVSFKDANDNTILPYINNYSNTGIDISKENASKITKVVLYSNGSSGKVFDKFYLSSVDREYQPYKETFSTIPTENGLAGIKVYSNGNYTDSNGQQWICDEIVKYADGSGEYIQRIGKAVFDGSEDEGWRVESTNADGMYRNRTNILVGLIVNSSTSAETIKGICTHYLFRPSNTNGTYGRKQGISVNTIGSVYIYDDIYNTADVSLWKNYLAENPITCLLELAEPIITPLTAEEIAEIEKLQTFKPITNISNNEQCGMKITYAILQEALMLQEALNGSKANAEEIVDVKQDLSDTTFKVETIIEKADLGIKETASGEEIHLIDSAEGKAVEFALYGKAEQNTTQGNQLFEFAKGLNKEKNGIKFNDNGDGTLSIIGLATASEGIFALGDSYTGTNVVLSLKAGTYYVSGLPNGLKFYLYKANTEKADPVYKNANGSFTLDTDTDFVSVSLRWAVDIEFNSPITKIMLNSGTTALPWESFTNGASPNPQYPQPIEVSGESYNLLENTATSKTAYGVTFTVNEDKSVTIIGTNNATEGVVLDIPLNLVDGESYIASGVKDGSESTYQACLQKPDWSTIKGGTILNGEKIFTKDSGDYNVVRYRIRITQGATVNTTIYPMIRKASVKNDRYMPFGVNSVEVKSFGSNLYNINDRKSFPTINIYENDWIENSYTNTTSGTKYIQFTTNPGKLIKPNKEYLCVCECVENTADSLIISSNGSGGVFGQFNTNFRYSKDETGTKLQIVKAISDFSDCNALLRTLVQVNAGSTAKVKFRISILEDTTITADNFVYEPYKETLATIPTPNGLAGIKVSSNGNYTDSNGQQWICDEIVKYADGSWEKIQRVGSDIITNVTSFVGGTTGGLNASDINTSQPFNSMGKETAVMCNYYSVPKNTTGWSSTEPCIISRTNNSSLRIHWQKEITTKEQANEFLANNEVIAYYILAEPITTPLTAEEIAEIEKLHTFYPVTNISNDFDCGMKIEYVGDSIITTNTEIPIVEPKDEEELQDGDNIVTLFGKIKKLLKNAGKGVVDVVDNLLSTSATSPLSANQGRVLDGKISTLNEGLEDLGQSLNDISNLINEQITEQISNISTRLSTLEQNQKTIIYSDTEPETVEENTIVMVYETEE